jgi:hypothetical protein
MSAALSVLRTTGGRLGPQLPDRFHRIKGFARRRAHSPGPKPTDEHNRCELKPGTPRRSKNALSLVCLLQSLPPYVVYFGLPRFAVPKPVPEAVPGRSARLTCPRKRFETERRFSCPRCSNHAARIGYHRRQAIARQECDNLMDPFSGGEGAGGPRCGCPPRARREGRRRTAGASWHESGLAFSPPPPSGILFP